MENKKRYIIQEKKRKQSINNGYKDRFLTKNSKRMISNPTNAEELFKKILIENKIPFKQQVPFCHKGHKYIFDFLVCDKWIVEIDGGYHLLTEQKKKDEIRDTLVQKLSFKERRFTNDDIINYSNNFKNWLNGIIGGYKL